MAPEHEEGSLRQRLLCDEDEEPTISNLTEDERAALNQVIKRNKSNFSLSTVAWMVAGMMVFQYTDFASVLLYDSRVNGPLLKVGAAMISINLVVGAYLVVYLSWIRGKTDWTNHTHPALIPIATLCACIGLVMCTVALWPVWGFFTLPILFTLFMGLIMLATLMPF